MRSDRLTTTLSAPVTVTWELNRSCNLHCAHCLSASGHGIETSLPAAYHIIDEFASQGVFQVNLGGGEPLLHSNIFPILEQCVDRDLVTCLSTNGTLVTRDIASRLAELGIRVQVSLDGASEEINDAMRGQGTFRRIMQGLELLSGHRLPLVINVVLTRLSFAELDRLLVLAQEHGAKLRVSRLRPSGRAEDAWESLHPSREQLLPLRDWLGHHPNVLTGDSFFFLNGPGQKPSTLNGCGAASMTCCVSPEGDLYPCAFMQWEPFRAGNLIETSLASLWSEAPAFKQIRAELATCISCDQVQSCGGGCPAVSYGVRGSATAPDPECLADVPFLIR